MENVTLERLLRAMEQQLAGDLHSVYVVPSSGAGYFVQGRQADVLLLTVADYKHLHPMRQLMLEVSANRSKESRHFAPLIATRSMLTRHMTLSPLFSHHVARNGRHLAGDTLFDSLPKAPHPAEQVAYLAAQAVNSSAALAPEKLPAKIASLASLDLCRLAVYFDERAAENQLPPADLFFLVQIHLERLLDQIGDGKKFRSAASISDTAFQPEAIFEDRASLLVVIPPGSGKTIRTFNWPSLVQRMPQHLSRLAVTTAEQLRLVTQAGRPLDYVLGTYRHIWGKKPLEGMKVTAWAVFRQAAHRSSELLINNLAGDYLVARTDEDVHRIIHDYQNRLLNMRLEQELLNRIHGSQLPDVELEPPGPLPKRDEPLHVRIDAIAEQLDWWADQYAHHMKSKAASQKLSPL